tara:strand:- start:2619 stop:2924 length:306 start_codon:yes stop_codon:yes gene_type:complete
MYRPLPDYLSVKESNIEGYGLFAVKNIEKGVCAGITHITDAVTNQLYRTPLGGFINHSEEPNAKLVDIQRFKYLYFLKDIKQGEEITLKYTLYSIKKIAYV